MYNYEILNKYNDKFKECFNLANKSFDTSITFCLPKHTISLSSTGSKCSLNCSHCNAKYLKSMHPIDKTLSFLKTKVFSSALISGGCNESGEVVHFEKIDKIKNLRTNGIKLNIHTGLISDKNIDKIIDKSDIISFDFLTDNETIRSVYGINKTGDDYISTFKKLSQKTTIVPHVCIGLYGGKIKGEYDALRTLKSLGVTKLILIIFIPTKGTAYENQHPPNIEDVIKVFIEARNLFSEGIVQLGCMRPRNTYKDIVDIAALRCGFNTIVNPSKSAIEEAENLGLIIKKTYECCVF